jgi:hypothetical protein
MSRGVWLPVLAAIPLAFGCGGPWEGLSSGSRLVLEAPEAVELLALVPFPTVVEAPLKAGERSFHGFRVRSSGPLEDARAAAALIELLREGVARGDGKVALCFLPRHGLRVSRGEDRVDLVVCFECFQIRCYDARGERADLQTSAALEPEVTRFFEERGHAIQR